MQYWKRITQYAPGFLIATLIVASAVLLWFQLQDVSTREVETLVGRLGYSLPLILLPSVFVLLLDVLGWRQCMNTTQFISLRTLLAIRISTDALMNTLPGGVAVAEPMRIVMLNRRLDMPLPEAASATILSKMNIAIAQMLFVLLGVVFALLHSGQHQGLTEVLNHAGGWMTVVPVAVVVLGILALPYSGPRFTQVLGILRRIPLRALQHRIANAEPTLADIDRYIRGFGRGNHGRFVTTIILFFWGWVLMALETWLILNILGADISISQALVFEGLASIVKLMFFFLPSGIGAQDVSFVAMLFAFGIPDAGAVAVAFMLLRRGKELFWVISGLGLLAYQRLRPLRNPVAAPPTAMMEVPS